jgi:osmotically-inducible protein OsmY
MVEPARIVVLLGVLIAAACQLSGCAAVVVGAGAAGAVAATEERGVSGVASDTAIRTKINELWFDHSAEMYQNVSLQVQEGRVLLTGKVKEPQMRLDAVRLAWQAQGVKEVINEIQVTEEGGIQSYARDTWISTQLKSNLLLDKQVSSQNYSIETVGGVVYIMGVAKSQAELDRVTNHARNLSYVRRVVSYVKLRDDPTRQKT